jgi:hypothetical protein
LLYLLLSFSICTWDVTPVNAQDINVTITDNCGIYSGTYVNLGLLNSYYHFEGIFFGTSFRISYSGTEWELLEYYHNNNSYQYFRSSSASSGLYPPTTGWIVTGCGNGSLSWSMASPTLALSVTSSSQTNVSCFGGSNGAASINTPTGGAGGYTYDWSPGNPAGDGTVSVTGLTAGTWTCTVTDANSVTATQSFTVTEPTTLSVTPSSQTNVSCFGGSNGAASINTPTGGAGGYTYDWTPGTPAGDGTGSVTGLTAGTWTCTVTDANSCTATQSFTVTEPALVNAPTGNASETFCSTVNATIASIQVTGTGIQWYASNTGGSVLATTTPLVTGTTYYATQTITGCESPSYLAVTVTIPVASIYYADLDGDGYGAGTANNACTQPSGYVLTNTDCNDNNAAVNPAATEVCNGIDDDCDGSIEVQPAMPTSTPSTNYTSLSAFTTAAVTTGLTISSTETFNSYNGYYASPLTGSFGAGAPTWSATAAGGLFCQSGLFSTNNPVAVTFTFSPGVTGFGANFFGTDNAFNVIPGTITVTYLNGDVYVFSSTSANDFFGVTSNSSLITSVTIGVMDSTPGDIYTTVDNLVIATGTINSPLACYQSYVYNSNTCSWEVTGTQPSQPTLACYETATFNTTSCVWDITGSPPVAPTGNASQTFCSTVNATIASIQATGTGIQWYASNTGGSVLATTTPLVTGTTYYATQTINGCESPSYLAVTVTIPVASTYYLDADGDSYGNSGSSVQGCTLPVGYVTNSSDCNDTNIAINPTTIWYLNADGDGYYVWTSVSCTSPGANYNTTGGTAGDCNDTNAAVHPLATETCNGIDDDCDGMIDENSSNTY